MNDVGNTHTPYDPSSNERESGVHDNKPVRAATHLLSSTVLFSLLVALVLALFVRFFIAAPYMVSGASMEPTFEPWNYLIIDRVSYQFSEPHRGDVIVFRFPQDPSRSFIKRVIGLPGETVTLSENAVIIKNEEYPDGFALDEPYLTDQTMRVSRMTVEIGENEYFVLGDNRRESADSRVWGTLSRDLIIGKVLVRLYPLSSVDFRPGEARYQDAQ
jgi:signal peptidase I